MTPGFIAFVQDVFAPLGKVEVKRMFGGGGVWHGGTMFALLSDERIYLKTNAATRAAFDQAGAEEFVWQNPKTKALWHSGYCEMPAALYDDAEALKLWALQALEVARAGKPKRAAKPKPKAKPKAKPAPVKRR